MRVIIVGAGGHGQVVADILRRMQERDARVQPLGFVDDDASLAGRVIAGLPVLGICDDLCRLGHDYVTVAIGDNAIRMQVCMRLTDRGEHFACARHPSAVVAPDVQVGIGTVICAGAVVGTQAVIGAHVILNTGSTVDHHNRISDYAHIAPGAHLGGTVSIANGAFIGIGANVMPGCSVGAWSIAGAGAAVIADIPACAVAVGVPARVIRTLSRTNILEAS
jgi:sugar O-acyltransferase (sialic acid O-acetyltransferase NeuD family)